MLNCIWFLGFNKLVCLYYRWLNHREHKYSNKSVLLIAGQRQARPGVCWRDHVHTVKTTKETLMVSQPTTKHPVQRKQLPWLICNQTGGERSSVKEIPPNPKSNQHSLISYMAQPFKTICLLVHLLLKGTKISKCLCGGWVKTIETTNLNSD